MNQKGLGVEKEGVKYMPSVASPVKPEKATEFHVANGT
jgi:hypothetical protein